VHVLVIGGTGFVGPYVVRALDRLGHRVTIVHSGAHEAELPPTVRHVHLAFARFAEHADELRRAAPDVVVDMIPFVRGDVDRVRTFAGTAQRSVVISSADVYRAFGRGHGSEPGLPDPTPLTEDSPLRSVVIDRGYDKVAVEAEAAAIDGLPATILRLPAIHGPGDRQHRLRAYVRRMDDRRPAIVIDVALANWRWVRGYVEDCAHAIVLAATNQAAAGRVYNVAYERHFTEPEWIREVARGVGWDGDVVLASSHELPKDDRIQFDTKQQFVVDSRRIRDELGYAEVVDFDDALRRTIEWERRNRGDAPNYGAEDEVLARLSRSSSVSTNS
jgi:nucleoside-diphosphate-sugar epimerase